MLSTRIVLILCFVSSIVATDVIKAQPINNFTKDISIPSPNTAALGKYVDIPVDLSTGIPSISTPIYSIQEGSLNLPISLDYHASGVKVSEVSSWVGLNWSLNAGGTISRTILGYPDDMYWGGMAQNRSHTPNFNSQLTADEIATRMNEIQSNGIDGEPDMFSFAFAGYKGRFMFDAQGTCHLIPRQNLKVLINDVYESIPANFSELFTSFTIVTPEGNRYIFGRTVDANGMGDMSAVSQKEVNNPGIGGQSGLYGLSFYLKKIETHDKKFTINLIYGERERFNIRTLANEQKIDTETPRYMSNVLPLAYPLPEDGSGITTPYYESYGQKIDGFYSNTEACIGDPLLTQITTSSNSVNIVFNHSTTNREDLEYPSIKYGRSLASIDISTGGFCQKVKLIQTYFASTQLTNRAFSKRLRLDGLETYVCGQTTPAQITSFIYEGTGTDLPHRLSKAIDHWGFYNGAETNNNNDINIPSTQIDNITYGSSNRESNETYMKRGVLRKIILPTGGFTEFDYEANKVQTPQIETYLCMETDCNTPKSKSLLFLNSTTELNNLKVTLKLQRDAENCSNSTNASANLKIYSPSNTLLYELPISFATGDNTQEIILEKNSNTTASLLSLSTSNANSVVLEVTNGRASVVISRDITVQSSEKIVGGLRIKTVTSKISDNDVNPIIRQYKYTDTDNSTLTSGILTTAIPTYAFKFKDMNSSPVSPDYHIFFQNRSIVPLGDYDGYHVRYRRVVVEESNGAKSEFLYDVQPEIVDRTFPITPFQYRKNNGQLKKKTLSTPNTVISVSEMFPTDEQNQNIIKGNFVKIIPYQAELPTTSFPIYPNWQAGTPYTKQQFGSMFKFYRIKTAIYRLKQQKDTKDGVTTIVDYSYYNTRLNFPLYPISIKITNSDNVETEIKYRYINEVIGSGGDNFINAFAAGMMIDRNIISTPVEITKKLGGVLISGSKSTFGLFKKADGTPTIVGGSVNIADCHVYPEKIYEYKRLTVNEADNWQLQGAFTAYDINTGLPKEFLGKGQTEKKYYDWKLNGSLQESRFGGLKWQYTYYGTSRLLSSTVDENGLKQKFYYDDLLRPLKIEDRMKEDGTDIQAKSVYTYKYKNATEPYNYIEDITTYANGYPLNTTAPTMAPIVTKQFVDGLGRPLMFQQEGHNSSSQYQKSYITYDALGRRDRIYQPFDSNTPGVDNDITATLNNKLYSQIIYESSPLSRPIEQVAADGKKIRVKYGTNIASEVRFFTATSSIAFNTPPTVLNSSTYYAANSLSKISVWNENSFSAAVFDTTKIGKTEVFKDKLGRTILTRKYVLNSTSYNWDEVNTYYVYDNFGNLAMIIPPGAENAGVVTSELTFKYIFDNQNRLRGKKIPNRDWEYFYYNSRDLLVLSQDGNIRNSTSPIGTKYMGIEYDPLGRLYKTGFITITNTDPSVYLQSNNVTIDENTYLTKNVYYANKTWINFTYNRVLTASGVSAPKSVLYTEYDQVRPNLYNYKGFPYWVNKENLIGIDEMNQDFNGAGKPTYSNRYAFVDYEANYGNFSHIWEVHSYDNLVRLQSSSYQFSDAVTGVNIPSREMTNLTYDEQDRIITRKMSQKNGKYLQTTNYIYNTRGWLTNINIDPVLNPSSRDYPIFSCVDGAINNAEYNNALTFPIPNNGEDNADLFHEVIRYDNPEQAIPNGNNGNTPPQYNGNISQIRWQVAGHEVQAYSFNYDNLDRLNIANYSDIHTGLYQNKGWSSKYTYDNKYQEKVEYDLRGNIIKLQRNGLTGSMAQASNGLLYGCFGQIDNLTYNYDPNNTNRLWSVTDAVTGTERKKGFNQTVTGTAYYYDANGNLTYDKNKGMSIEYNHLNLPTRIIFTREITSGGVTTTFTKGVIEFMYSASGEKLQKKVDLYDLGGAYVSSTITNYSNGAEYDNNNSLVRLQHREGSVIKNNSGTFEYEYVLRDHLGNTRVTFGDAGDDGIIVSSDIKQINNYYPFGLNSEGPGFGFTGANKYQFNDKELNTDFGLNLNDYGARWYDAALGRFTTIDPLAELYNIQSPYVYADNNPVNLIDFMGLGGMDGDPNYDPTKDADLGRFKGQQFQQEVTITASRIVKSDQSSSLLEELAVLWDRSGTFAQGVRDAFLSNIALNFPGTRTDPNEKFDDEQDAEDFADGQTAGDILAVIFGVGEVLVGEGTTVVSVVAEVPSFGTSTVGVVGGQAIAVHGAGVLGTAISNLAFGKESKKSGKEKGNDIPSWAKGKKPNTGEKPTDFAKRVMDEKYGKGNWKEGAGQEYNKIRKAAERTKK